MVERTGPSKDEALPGQGKEKIMTTTDARLTRRTALTALAASGVILAAPAAHGAPASDKKAALERAVETLRVAMIEGDEQRLNALLHDHLNYMHSSGNSQTKEKLLGDLAGKRFFAGLTYSDQTVDVVDNTGTVVQTVDQVKNLPDGKTRASQIKVLQTWVYVQGTWKLLSRVSAIIYSPLTAPSCPQG